MSLPAEPRTDVLEGAPPARALAAWVAALEAAGAASPGGAERCDVGAALGRVLAEDLRARHANPPHRCAAMDGVAVRAADTAGAPVVLRAGAFAPIDTGQHVDPGWDAVVPLEELDRLDADVRIRHAVEPGRHVRPAGEDVAAGALVAVAGRRLEPADLGLAVACGHAEVLVRPRPRVGLIPTGDEVRPPGSELAPGEIPDANSVMLSAMLREAGALPDALPIAPDRPAALADAVRAAAARSDLVLMLAGSSRGARDHTAAVLGSCGELIVRGVALRPAHPVLLAVVDATPVVGVPGYPVSAALAFDRFVAPVLALLSGASPRAALTRPAVLGRAILGRPGDELVVPVVLEPRDGADPLAWPQSRRGGALAAHARADATLAIPAGTGELAAGDPVTVTLRRSA